MRNLYLSVILLLSLPIFLIAQPCADDESTVVITVNTDNFPGETSWILIDNNTQITYDSIVAGEYSNSSFTYTHELCIPQDACVTFIMQDSFGDGICCGFGDGSYAVTLNGEVIASGDNFGSEECTSFNCPVGTGCTSAIPITEGSYTTETADYWYEFAPTEAGQYSISTCDLNDCNTKIWIYDNCSSCTFSDSNTGTIFYNNNNDECGLDALLNIPLSSPNVYYIRIGDAADDCESIGNINWTLSYEGPLMGCTDPEACNYNPLAGEDDGSCIYENCDGPDLVLLQDVIENSIEMGNINNADGCLIGEGCVSGYGQREIIEFTTHIKNIGTTDYLIGEPTLESDQFTYDNCHGHYHYDGYAEYVLYDANNVETPAGFKNGFCVIDLECSDGGFGQYSCGYMGITAGCGDIYSKGLECQWIDITDIDDGTYTFVARVNWDNAPDLLGRYETDFTNNWAQVCINIYTTVNGVRGFEIAETCEPYVDCAGVTYGPAQPDCTGECNGSVLMGDINADGLQAMEDAHDYITQILGNDIATTPCNDLNADDQITVYDAALLSSCLNYGMAHQHPETNAHDHCDFPMGLTNPNDLVTLEIKDVNFSEQYIDIDVHNPNNSINAYQFTMSGIEIMTVENLVDPVAYPITPSTVPGGDMVIGISYEDSLIVKSDTMKALCRIHYSNITNDEICIASIQSIVNQDYEETLTAIGGTCIEVVGVSNPLTTIEASITPNPTKGDAILTFPNTTNEAFTLKITDATGRMIRQYEALKSTQHTIERGHLTSGVYLYHLQSDTKTATGKFVIQD